MTINEDEGVAGETMWAPPRTKTAKRHQPLSASDRFKLAVFLGAVAFGTLLGGMGAHFWLSTNPSALENEIFGPYAFAFATPVIGAVIGWIAAVLIVEKDIRIARGTTRYFVTQGRRANADDVFRGAAIGYGLMLLVTGPTGGCIWLWGPLIGLTIAGAGLGGLAFSFAGLWIIRDR